MSSLPEKYKDIKQLAEELIKERGSLNTRVSVISASCLELLSDLEIAMEALEKMANHNERLAMKDRPGMTAEGWSIDKAFAIFAEEALNKIMRGEP